MKPSRETAFFWVHCGLVRVAAYIVPSACRDEWRREWIAELWHVCSSRCEMEAPSWEGQRAIALFCIGAFPDALCLRSLESRAIPQRAHAHGAPAHCLLALSVCLAACWVLAHMLPGVQAEKDASQAQVNPAALIVADTESTGESPSIPHNLFRNWKATRQRYFEDLAFYRMSREAASYGSTRLDWNVAHATSNLFPLLGLALKDGDAGSGLLREPAGVILSHSIWKRDFASDIHVAGRAIRIGKREARIAGVAPPGEWRLPGQADVWLLEPDAEIAPAGQSRIDGYLIVQLSDRGKAAMVGNSISIMARGPQDSDLELYGVPVAVPVEGAWNIYAFALFLAIVALPAVTSVSLGESNISSHRLSRRQALRRVLFMVAKCLLLAAVAYYASLDCAYWHTSTYSPSAECIQLIAAFVICLFGFRWAIADQRRRCPVCLRPVTQPASVGLASRTFLGWNGIEMMCMGGHALLHVPSLPTSWFNGQRWLLLDSSWDFLFADSYLL